MDGAHRHTTPSILRQRSSASTWCYVKYGAKFCYNYDTTGKSEEDEFMQIVNEKISCADLAKISGHYFGDMTKGVVDVEKEIVAIDAELHADLETLLLENGSRQEQLWGINLYPDENGEDFIEFDSLINIRPRQNNRGRGTQPLYFPNSLKAFSC